MGASIIIYSKHIYIYILSLFIFVLLQPHMEIAERKQGGNICGLSTCTLHEKALQHSLRRWPLLFCSRGCKKNTMAATRFCYAGYLLGQNPHAEAAVAGTKTKIHQLACAPFHVFRSGAVVKNDERVSLLKKETSKEEVGLTFTSCC